MRLWIDDVRPAPEGYIWVKSVGEARTRIIASDNMQETLKEVFHVEPNDNLKIELIDIDHDAGEYVNEGGDYIRLLDWLEETGRNYPIRIHSMNPVGCANMRRIIERNGWKEIK